MDRTRAADIVYYTDKLETLKDLFGTQNIQLTEHQLQVEDQIYPIMDDVIILLAPEQYPEAIRNRLHNTQKTSPTTTRDFAPDIQFTFSEEWRAFSQILPEHEKGFEQYFDLVDLEDLATKRVCDLGCGIGRWSYFLQEKCKELILVDFSEAIFIARRNIHGPNALFFMGDLKRLPFRENFADFLFSLGVLHHLPTNALEEVRALKKSAPSLLIYLYYALDNRPFYFHILLIFVTTLRRFFSTIRSALLRALIVWLITLGVYLPLIFLGKLLSRLGMGRYIPLYEIYHDKSVAHIRQDVYDRFFTRIEQRFSRKQIMELTDTFSEVTVSEKFPYWHFLCSR